MIKLEKSKHSIDLLFTILLLFIFAICSLLLVFYCIQIYTATIHSMNRNFSYRNGATYIREKIHQNDTKEAIDIEDKEGLSILSLSQTINDKDYITYIYSFEQQLHEITVVAGDPFSIGDGAKITDCKNIEFSMVDNQILKCEITLEDQIETVYSYLQTTD